MADTAQDVKTKIASAFTAAPYPGDDNLVADPSEWDPECREIARAFAGKRWIEVTPEIIGAHSQALPLFTPAGFRYYLPAYMMATIDAPDPEALRDFVVFNLAPPRRPTGRKADFFQARAGQFTAAEREAIRSFLGLMDERRSAEWRSQGAEPPDSPIRSAIDYWASGANK
jgi:hypothetical protein